MSRHDLDLPLHRRPSRPARRAALFALHDAMLAALAGWATPSAAGPSARTAAPALNVVHGFCDQQSCLLWLQGRATGAGPTDRQRLRIVCTRADASAGEPVLTETVLLDPRNDHAVTVRLFGLEPGTRYRYGIARVGDKSVLAGGEFATQPLWQWRSDPPTVRLAVGACAYLNDGRFDRPGTPYGGGTEIFDAIAALAPDCMLWLGDNIYLREPEWTSAEGINRRYRFYREHPALRRLWQATAHVAIWDDHDFGPNDSDGSFVNKAWTRAMFDRYWPVPYAAPADGVYGQLQLGDVDLFLLDDRSNRFPDDWPVTDAAKAMFGAAQLRWLKGALLVSKAPFKLVAGGGQFWNAASRFECWSVQYPDEAADLRRWLDGQRIPGVLFVSGDRHFAELLQTERPGSYPLTELTTSPLTAGPVTQPDAAEDGNPQLVPGTLYRDRNFALLTVSGPARQRVLSIELMDTRGQRVWQRQVAAADLEVPPAPRTAPSAAR